ncbi:AAA family ATPase [Streptococcus suis]|uniref:AAA family ATPase n=1 Tax=Streptococcus suis TaxID=1307 RepID=UPI0037D55BBD
MKRFQIKNLRSIKDSGVIDIGGVNFFVGANGTGKSSILRFFPLVKQTVSQKNSSPLLWYAKDGVDLGSFNESVNKLDSEKGITFVLEFEETITVSSKLVSNIIINSYLEKYQKNTTRESFLENWMWFYQNVSEILVQKIEVTILDTIFMKLKIFFNDTTVEFDIQENKIISHNTEFEIENIITKKEEYPLLPRLFVELDSKTSRMEKYFAHKIIDLMMKEASPRIKWKTWVNIFEKLNYSKQKENILQGLRIQKLPKTVTNKFLDSDSQLSNELYSYISIILACKLLYESNQLISEYFKNITYIAPIRATAERYYRVQGLSVEEVDPMGINVPMILDYMRSNNSEQSWQDWTMSNFNIKYRANTNGGNTSIEVYIDGEYYNLADTGFGYSQFLPILLMLWQEESSTDEYKQNAEINFFANANRKKYTPRKTVVIEQPELHLHPKMQSQFAELLFNLVTRQDNKVDFIIETHSITIINKIGELIEQKNLGADTSLAEKLFNLYLVNAHSDKKIVKTQYDKDGVIKEWPIGFL